MSVPTTTMRIDPELKDRANKVLGELGLLTPTGMVIATTEEGGE